MTWGEFSFSVLLRQIQYQKFLTYSPPYVSDANVILSSIDGVSRTLKLPVEMVFYIQTKFNIVYRRHSKSGHRTVSCFLEENKLSDLGRSSHDEFEMKQLKFPMLMFSVIWSLFPTYGIVILFLKQWERLINSKCTFRQVLLCYLDTITFNITFYWPPCLSYGTSFFFIKETFCGGCVAFISDLMNTLSG